MKERETLYEGREAVAAAAVAAAAAAAHSCFARGMWICFWATLLGPSFCFSIKMHFLFYFIARSSMGGLYCLMSCLFLSVCLFFVCCFARLRDNVDSEQSAATSPS